MGQVVQADFRAERKGPTLTGIVELMAMNGLNQEDFNVGEYRVRVSLEKSDGKAS